MTVGMEEDSEYGEDETEEQNVSDWKYSPVWLLQLANKSIKIFPDKCNTVITSRTLQSKGLSTGQARWTPKQSNIP